MTTTAKLVHALNQKINHMPSKKDDPWFARGRMATVLMRQAITLAYFGKVNYEEAVAQVYRDFALQGTPRESQMATMILPTDCAFIAKFFRDTCEGRKTVQTSDLWVIEESKTLTLRPVDKSWAEFDYVNLITGTAHYHHELESCSHDFTYFLTQEDHAVFKQQLENIKNQINRRNR